ncbi:MAG TPA: zinc ribbon domain-containing protein [Gemmatimonadaceae bacterium]|nr:zinc ribbon domain-containing protein [Gemmatimonadaceae bacterium]
MDDLDRLFRRLVQNIRNGHAEYLSVPFTVAELHDTLVPYRHYRRDLGIETNQDYEAAVTRLISGERGYIRADEAMQQRLKKELGSAHADPGLFREYASARISLVPDAVKDLGVPIPAQNAGGYSSGSRAGVKGGGSSGNGGATTFTVPSLAAMDIAEGCRYCGGTLPEGRAITYCPHCGQNLAAKHCAGCGAELDPAWKFCVSCGKQSS